MSTNTDAFAAMADVLFGDSSRELIEKMNPVGSDMSTTSKKKDRKQRKVTAALSAVGAGAGAYGLGVGASEIRRHTGEAKAAGLKRPFRAGLKATPRSVKALIPLEVAGLGGELMATKILHNDTKKKIRKNLPTNLKPLSQDDAKVEFSGELSKLDSDKRQVFGWASVTKVDGQDVFDRQGDYIALEEIEKSAYHYVHHSRKGGDMHERQGEVPLHKSDMIESFVVTPEKLSKMGLDADALPHGWWVGYQVNDDNLWGMVKDGKRVGFSIHGKGVRTPMGGI